MILLIICYVVLAFISPVLSVILSFISIIVFQDKKYFILISLFNLSFFLGLINSLKVYESDLLNYITSYRHATHTTDWLTYVFQFKKEPLFYFFTKAINYISSANESFYIISFTTLGYFVLFYALWRVHDYYRLSINNFVLAIFCAFFFPNLFTLSAHLVRQFIASSFIVLFLVNRFYYDRNSVVFLALAFLFHSTSLVFAICCLPLFNMKMSSRKMFLVSLVSLGGLMFVSKLLSVLLSVLSKVPLLSYVINRAVTSEEMETEPISLLMLIFNGLIIGVFYLITKKEKFKNLINTNFKFLYVTLLLFIFILLNRNSGIISMRFSFYMYFFLPLGFYFLTEFIPGKVAKSLFQFTISLVLVYWFIHKINNGVWTYIDIYKVF